MGVGVILSQALRKLGVDSYVLSSAPHPFGFKEDYLFPKRPYLKSYLRRIVRRLEWRKFYDFEILHSHDNKRLPDYVLKKWRGALVQHYHDAHTEKPLYNNVPSFVSLPNILKAVPNATWLPFPVDTDFFRPAKNVAHDKVTIGYYDQPTEIGKLRFIPKREIKKTIAMLGSRVRDYPLAHIIPYSKLKNEYYENVDIWVDRIGLDFYGLTAVELASMGKAVITQIGETEKSFVPECPFISTDRDGVLDALTTLVQDEKLRYSLEKKSREYAVAVHDSFKAASACLRQYEELRKRI